MIRQPASKVQRSGSKTPRPQRALICLGHVGCCDLRSSRRGSSGEKPYQEAFAGETVPRVRLNSLIARCEAKRMGSKDESLGFVSSFGPNKINPDEAHRIMALYMFEGVALGFGAPDTVKAMCERQYGSVDPKSWQEAHDAGVDVGDSPYCLSYDEAEKQLLLGFGEFVRQFRPNDSELLAYLT